MADDLRTALGCLQCCHSLLTKVANDLAVDVAADGPPRGFDIDDLHGTDFPLGRILGAVSQVETVISSIEQEIA